MKSLVTHICLMVLMVAGFTIKAATTEFMSPQEALQQANQLMQSPEYQRAREEARRQVTGGQVTGGLAIWELYPQDYMNPEEAVRQADLLTAQRQQELMSPEEAVREADILLQQGTLQQEQDDTGVRQQEDMRSIRNVILLVIAVSLPLIVAAGWATKRFLAEYHLLHQKRRESDTQRKQRKDRKKDQGMSDQEETPKEETFKQE